MAAFLVLAVAATQSAELRCEYKLSPYQARDYQCSGQISTTTSDYVVDNVVGNHISGMGNDEVTEIIFSNVSMEVMPKNLNKFFRNYREFGIANIRNFPNFNREMFGDFTYLTMFFSYNLPMVTDIPRDAFWELTRLNRLHIDGMRNMKNLDGDLLVKATALEFFSARGPNQMTQINPGFFRNQMRTLKTVDFRNTQFMRIGYSVFQNFGALRDARFVNSGCLNRMYFQNVASMLTADIRAHCQDVTRENDNEIRRNKQQWSSSSSTSSESH